MVVQGLISEFYCNEEDWLSYFEKMKLYFTSKEIELA